MKLNIKNKFNELSVLAPLLTIYTLAYLALMGLDFAAKGEFDVPAGLMAVYFALLLAYATDKEIRRWTGKESPPRKGTLFVYLWMIFYLVIFIIHSLKPEYALPKDLTTVTLQVLGIFFGSKVSKKIFQARAQKLEEETVLDVIRKKGQAKREDLLSATGMSKSSLGRLLDKMEEKGLIAQIGDRKASHYTLK